MLRSRTAHSPEVVLVVVIIVVVALGIMIGYAMRQREELADAKDEIEALTAEDRQLRDKIAELQAMNKAHEFSLEMVLNETDES